MNITTSRGENYTTKEEREKVEEKNPKAASTGTSIIPWSRLKDPRIVRVSRAFGGKDRHSKVCTVKGLRDRRVRLSVPTAIQLYDLQERLGLNQPSKVVDWLLNAAKHDIDELPPLQIPQEGNFFQNHGIGALDHWDEEGQLGLSRSSFRNSDDALRVKSKEVATEETTNDQKENWDVGNEIGLSRSSFWNSDDASLRDKSKEVATEEITTNDHKVNWNRGNEEEKRRYVSSHNHHSFFPGLVNNVIPYNSFYRLDPGDFSLGISHGFSSMAQTEDFLNFNFVPNGSQVPQPYFPSHVATSLELDIPKQINHFHHEMLNSNSSQIPLPSSSTPTLYSLDQSMRPLPLKQVVEAKQIITNVDHVEFPPK